MITQGIIINDEKNHFLAVELHHILEEINNGATFSWNILELDAVGDIGEVIEYGFHDEYYQEEINNSKNGIDISWDKLKLFSLKINQILDGIIIGSKDPALLRRYSDKKTLYETCDIVIEVFDCSFWKVFSKDIILIQRLVRKFNDIVLIDSTDKNWNTEDI